MTKKTPTPTLHTIGENALIASISRWLSAKPSATRKTTSTPAPGPWAHMETITAIGDDTAIVRPSPQSPPLALTTDMLIEGVHFLPDHPPQLLGAKAVAANLSDLAAIGAWPAWILVSLGAPSITPVAWVEALYAGIREAMAPYGCLCIGGDCVRAERLTINIVAGGNCDPSTPIPLRSNAKPGQFVYVTGTLGDSGAGLQLLKKPLPLPANLHRDRDFLIERHRQPTPRVEAGIAIAKACPDAAMMDLSDGLAADLPRMAQASRCGFKIHLPRLPISPTLKRLEQCLEQPAEVFAVRGGEDYELLFTTALPLQDLRKAIQGIIPRPPIRLTQIGAVFSSEKPAIQYVLAKGLSFPAPESSFTHY